jgi:hypothetical protein
MSMISRTGLDLKRAIIVEDYRYESG